MNMLDATTPIDTFLTAAAAKHPTPGGGAAAALAGALAAAMGEMVLAYSVDKKSLAAYADANRRAMAEMTIARTTLLGLMAEDQAAFQRLTDARKAGGDTAALVDAAIAIPNAIGTTALAVLDAAVRVAPTSNTFLASDLAVCGDLAMATVRCAVHNVRANLADVSVERATGLDTDCRALLARGIERVTALTALTAAIARAGGAG